MSDENIVVKDTFKVKTKRTEHPNATKYPGRPSLEFGTALRKFLSEITTEEMELFSDGEFVYNEEDSAEFYDSIFEGDVVGLGVLYGLGEKKEPTAYKFKIQKIFPGEDKMLARNVTWEHPKRTYRGEEVELTFQDISCAFGMGFGEILERDGKPFGVAEEVELTVKVYGQADEESQTDPNTANNTNPLQTV